MSVCVLYGYVDINEQKMVFIETELYIKVKCLTWQ